MQNHDQDIYHTKNKKNSTQVTNFLTDFLLLIRHQTEFLKKVEKKSLLWKLVCQHIKKKILWSPLETRTHSLEKYHFSSVDVKGSERDHCESHKSSSLCISSLKVIKTFEKKNKPRPKP